MNASERFGIVRIWLDRLTSFIQENCAEQIWIQSTKEIPRIQTRTLEPCGKIGGIEGMFGCEQPNVARIQSCISYYFIEREYSPP